MSIELPSLLKQPPPRNPEAVRAYVSTARKGVYRRPIALISILLLVGFSFASFGDTSNDRWSVIIFASVTAAALITAISFYATVSTKRQLIQVLLHGTPCKAIILQNDLGHRARNMMIELSTEQGPRHGIVYIPALAPGQFKNKFESIAFIADKKLAFFAPRSDQPPMPYLGTLL